MLNGSSLNLCSLFLFLFIVSNNPFVLGDDDQFELGSLFPALHVAVVGSGWGGMFSAWRLATHYGSDPTKRVRVFEKLDRIGGRSFFVDDTMVPELSGLEVNAGAYRFNEVEETLTAELHRLFQVPTRCYFASTSLDPQPTIDNCPSPQRQHVYTRGEWITPAEQDTSSNFPYELENISWAPPSGLSSRPNIARTAILEAFPFLTDPALDDPDPTIRWAAVVAAIEKMKHCDTNGLCNVPGDNPATVPVIQIVHDQFPHEYWALEEVLGGSLSAYVGRTTDVYGDAARFALGKGRGPINKPFEVVKEGGGRKGYVTVPLKMAEAGAAAQGVTTSQFVRFGYQCTRIVKRMFLGITYYVLFFRNGERVAARNVIFNSQMFQVLNMDKTGNMLFTDASPMLQKAYAKEASPFAALKLYLHYDNAWWIDNGLVNGGILTEKYFKTVQWHDGHVICEGTPRKCRGLLFASYQINYNNEWRGLDWVEAGPDNSSVLYVLRNSSERDNQFLINMHEKLTKFAKIGGLIPENANYPPPSFGIYSNWITDPWIRGGNWHATTSVPPGEFEKTCIQPVPGENVFFVNKDFSTQNSFAESSLLMGEKVVRRYFGLPKHSGLNLDNAWYDANVNFDF